MAAILSVRRAVEEDYEDVLAIDGNIFDGLDYLADLYHEYLANPRNYAFVALLNGEIVGFLMLYIVDGGASAISKCARIKKQHLHKNLISQIMTNALGVVMLFHKGIQHIVSTTLDDNSVQKQIHSGRLLPHNVFKKIKVPAIIQPEKLKQVVSSLHFQNQSTTVYTTQVLTASQAETTLCRLDHHNFIPEGKWLLCYDPFRPVKSNYSHMINDQHATVVLGSENNDENRIISISFATTYNCKVGFKYNMSFYYDRSQLKSEAAIQSNLVAHVVKHLILVNQLQQKCDVYFWIYLSESFKTENIKRFLLEDLGFKRNMDNNADPTIAMELLINFSKL